MEVLESSLSGYVWSAMGPMSILNQSLGPGETVPWMPIPGPLPPLEPTVESVPT